MKKAVLFMENGLTVRTLCAQDYDEALDFLNMVFSMANRPHDFLRALPRMWARDDERMGKHIAVIRDGKIRSMLGVYPIPVTICGRKLLFSTVGNVATHPYEEGKGYMSLLLGEAMKTLNELGADASRLSGFRQRYARYGYEPIGRNYTFTLTGHNIRAARQVWSGGVSYKELGAQDGLLLRRAAELHRMGPMAAGRGGAEEFYRVLTAWESRPLAAFRDGKMIGYLVAAGEKGNLISECIAEDDEAAIDLLCGWVEEKEIPSVRISVEAWRVGLIRRLVSLCEDFSCAPPCRFLIRNWDTVTDALLALRQRMANLPSGEAVIGIEGWGALYIKVDGAKTSVQKTEEKPEIRLSPAQAAQLLAGSMKPEYVCGLPEHLSGLLSAWLPLPLSWCTLDRV